MNNQVSGKLKHFIGILVLATVIFYYAGSNWGLKAMGLNILFNLLFVITLALDKAMSIFRRQELVLFLLFLLLTFAAVFYPHIDYELFNFTITKILAAFMGAYIGLTLCKTLDLEDYFLFAFVLAFVLIIYAEYTLGHFNPVTFYAPTAARDDFLENANYYSYMALFANFSIFRLHLKYKNTWTLLGLMLIPFLGIAISFTTQSRSGLIFILLINALFWFWVNKPKIGNPVYTIMRKLLLLIFTLVLSFQFISVYTNSSIEDRISSTSNEESRGQLAKRAIEVFMDYPITGVGPGNFVNYSRGGKMSHNNYTEALAEHGFFIGFLIIFVFILPFFKSWRLFLTNKGNPEYKLNVLFFFIFLLFNNIYVFYRASNAMMFFFLMLGIHYKLLETKKQ